MLTVTPSIAIPEHALSERFVRASGPGGQNVNKVATAVELRLDIAASALPDDVKARLLARRGQADLRRRHPPDRQPRASGPRPRTARPPANGSSRWSRRPRSARSPAARPAPARPRRSAASRRRKSARTSRRGAAASGAKTRGCSPRPCSRSPWATRPPRSRSRRLPAPRPPRRWCSMATASRSTQGGRAEVPSTTHLLRPGPALLPARGGRPGLLLFPLRHAHHVAPHRSRAEHPRRHRREGRRRGELEGRPRVRSAGRSEGGQRQRPIGLSAGEWDAAQIAPGSRRASLRRSPRAGRPSRLPSGARSARRPSRRADLCAHGQDARAYGSPRCSAIYPPKDDEETRFFATRPIGRPPRA